MATAVTRAEEAIAAVHALATEIAEGDERVQAWHIVAAHPFFADCYPLERPLIETMIKKLDAAQDAENVALESWWEVHP